MLTCSADRHFSPGKLDKSVEQFILVAPVLLFSMVAHEYAHGYAALKQGDTTAYALGRLTWNPIPMPPLDGSHVFKYLLPPAWALNYQRLGARGLLILFVLISFGAPLLSIWFKPVFALSTLAARAVMPYILPSPWTM